MAGFDFTPEEERQLELELAQTQDRMRQKQRNSSPALAQNMSNFYRRFPYLTPDVLAPTVEAFTTGKMSEQDALKFIEDLSTREAQRAAEEAKNKKNKKKSWWERNISDKVKTGSRWAMAGLNFVPQAVTNLAAMGYQAGKDVKRGGWDEFDNAWSTKGFIISTDLGTLIENDEQAGEGFFVGGKAAELQAERARRFRGTIGGKAFTLGRGAATVVAQPGSDEYNRLSGLVDAVAAIVIPSVPGGKAVTGLAKGVAAETAGKAGLRTLAGLTNYESALIIPERVVDFLNTSGGRSIIKRMTKIKSVDEALDAFPTADVEWLQNVAKITDETAMRDFVGDSLGLPNSNLGVGPKNITDINISRYDSMKNYVKRESRMARLMSTMPGGHVIVSGGSNREKLEAVKNVRNYLRMLKIDPQQRADLVDEFANALISDDGSMKNVTESLSKVITASLKTNGANDAAVNQIMKNFFDTKDSFEKALYGAIADSGDAADFGGKFEAIVDGNVVLVNQPLNTAGLQSEMLRHAMMLPDARRTRRIMSNIGWVTGRKTGVNQGEARLPLAFLEWMQNDVWRPLTLMTGGYVLRNMSDSLLRQTFNPNVKTGIFHPLELINIAMFKKFSGDVLGESFIGDAETLIRNQQFELAEAVNATVREAVDPMKTFARQEKTGAWKRVRLSDGKNVFMKGVAAELSLLASDEAAAAIARGMSIGDVVRQLANDPDKKYLRSLQNRWKNRTLTDSNGQKLVGTVDFIDATGNVNITNVRNFVERYVLPRVDSTTGNNATLKEIIGTGKIGGEDAIIFDEAGRISQYNDDLLYKTLSDIVDDPNVVLKETYKMQETIDTVVPGKSKVRTRLFGEWDRAVDKFFGELYPKREAWLNRSPVFRQFYYKTVGQYVDGLSSAEAGRLLDNLQKVADKTGETFGSAWVAKYVGDGDLSQKLFDIRDGKISTVGDLTVEQIDAYAKGVALDETKRLFYDAADKSNFADVMRIIAPFGSAWAEVTKKWVGMLSSDPEILKRIGVTVQGLQEADPDGDGKGFFYKDPQTGEYVFNYPFSEQLAPFIGAAAGLVGGGIVGGVKGAAIGGIGLGAAGTAVSTQLDGITPQFVAPVKSLSMGLSLLPGVGPYVQAGAGWVLGDKPQFDDVKKILMPYGEPEISWVTVPAWAKKVIQAVTANPESDRLYGDLKLDTLKALSATGEYDLTTEEGKARLESDAASRARILLVLQALGQFTGPTRPSVEFKVPTGQGDVMANELSKAWYEMRATNFDTAVETFLETFGDDVALYMQGKTKSSVGGLDVSQEFGKWERQNANFMDKYSEVAGYFAPVGSNLDYRVYARQVSQGNRKRLSAQELIDEAQALVGSAMYRSAVRSIGGNPNEEQQAILRKYREDLGKKYPGFRDKAINIKELETDINKLYEAAFDPDMKNNPVAEAARIYLGYRDQAWEIVRQRGFNSLSGKQVADLRSILRQAGEDLAARIPEFERLWDRILYNEVDVVM